MGKAWVARLGRGVDPATRDLRRAPRWAVFAYPGFLIVAAVVAVVNALTAMSDDPHRYGSAGLAGALMVEATSIAAILLLLPALWRLVAWAPPEPGGWRRFAAVHLPATFLFSAAHVALFDLFRWAVAKTLPLPVCCVAPVEFFYEYRKDLIAYGALVGLMGVARLLDILASRRPTAAAAETISVRDGARTLRLGPSELVAVRAAGNYVEHLLADGRTVLERATLSDAASRLSPHGFVRTHRSWLVNPACVREITRDGSGDRTLTLSGGVQAPVSRRYASALEGIGG